MLSERALQLLTAYVDGELSGRQREQAESLVMESPEARRFLAELTQCAERIRKLPPRNLEPGFAQEVLAVIQGQQSPPVVRVAGRRWPSWTRYAVAASVLAVVAGGSIWLATRESSSGGQNIVKGPTTPEPKSHEPLRPARPGTKLAFEDLAKTQHHEVLLKDMSNLKAVHLDVAVSNQRQAVQRLETVLQNKGVKVVTDPPAFARLKEGRARTEYVIYAENIRADELAAMLYELGTDERARTSIETLTVSAVSEDDQRRMSQLLGIQRDELETPPARNNPFQTFIPKEEKKTGGEPGAAPVRPVFGRDTRVAMILANEPRSGKMSSELQYFLSERRQLQPGALRVMLVVHEA
jgi:hypothetical protein